MLSELEIRSQLIGLLTDKIQLEEFHEWLSLNSVDMHLDSSEEASALAAEIQYLLVEYMNESFDYESLRQHLTRLANNFHAVYFDTPVTVTAKSSNSSDVSTHSAYQDVPTWDPVPFGT